LKAVYLHGEENDTRHIEREEDDDREEKGPRLVYLHCPVPGGVDMNVTKTIHLPVQQGKLDCLLQ
jgi:hypothetical protein